MSLRPPDVLPTDPLANMRRSRTTRISSLQTAKSVLA
jgi:hypothetical protein